MNSPEQIEEEAFNPETGKYFQEVYDYHRLIKVKENKDCLEQFNSKVDQLKKTTEGPSRIWRKSSSFSRTFILKRCAWKIIQKYNRK